MRKIIGASFGVLLSLSQYTTAQTELLECPPGAYGGGGQYNADLSMCSAGITFPTDACLCPPGPDGVLYHRWYRPLYGSACYLGKVCPGGSHGCMIDGEVQCGTVCTVGRPINPMSCLKAMPDVAIASPTTGSGAVGTSGVTPPPVPPTPVKPPKKKPGGSSPHPIDPPTSATNVFVFEKANYWFNDIRTIRGISDSQACAGHCVDEARCIVATYSDETADPEWANSCVLRDAIGPRHTEQEGMYSWIKQYPVTEQSNDNEFVFEKANYWFNDIRTIRNVRSSQMCASYCVEEASCLVATYSDNTADSEWANTCVLRDAIGPRHTEQEGMYSWIKK